MKVKVQHNSLIYPKPVAIVGAVVNDKPNFMAVAWFSQVNYKPRMISVAHGKNKYTNEGILENRIFSVNIPSDNMIVKTDYVGLVSGRRKDKSGLFNVFYGDLKIAPMIDECPVCMECNLVQAVELPGSTIFIGEVVGEYVDESIITDGKPDIRKYAPFILTMPDSNYWKIGDHAGNAFEAGEGYEETDA